MVNRILRLLICLAVLWIGVIAFLCVGMWNNGFAPSNYLGNANVDHSSFLQEKKLEQDQRFRERGWIK